MFPASIIHKLGLLHNPFKDASCQNCKTGAPARDLPAKTMLEHPNLARSRRSRMRKTLRALTGAIVAAGCLATALHGHAQADPSLVITNTLRPSI